MRKRVDQGTSELELVWSGIIECPWAAYGRHSPYVAVFELYACALDKEVVIQVCVHAERCQSC